MRRYVSKWLSIALVVTGVAGAAMAQHPPAGQLTLGFSLTITPTYLDPAEAIQMTTSASLLYALHDALIKPMPGNRLEPCLATQWTESEDGLRYDFTLRQGATFHNGDPFTAEDVTFSFERYKGTEAKELKKHVKAIEIVHPHHVRFVLHAPWPDFGKFHSSDNSAL